MKSELQNSATVLPLLTFAPKNFLYLAFEITNIFRFFLCSFHIIFSVTNDWMYCCHSNVQEICHFTKDDFEMDTECWSPWNRCSKIPTVAWKRCWKNPCSLKNQILPHYAPPLKNLTNQGYKTRDLWNRNYKSWP